MSFYSKPWQLIAQILTAVPLLGSVGYILAFLHEIGYTSYFSMPNEFIKLDTTTILEGVGAALLLLLVFGLTFILWAVGNLSEPRRRSLSTLAMINVILTTPFLYASMRNYLGDISAYITIGLLLLQLLILSIVTRNKASRGKVRLNLSGRPVLSLALWGLFAVCLLAWVGGSTDVLFQREYLIPSTNPNSVVLRIYGDNIICAPLTDDSIIERSFFVLKLDEPNLTLHLREFPGRLRVASK